MSPNLTLLEGHVLIWRENLDTEMTWTEGKPWGCREADTTEQLTLGLTQSPPSVGTHLLAKMDSSIRVLWKVGRTYYGLMPSPFFDLWGTFFFFGSCLVGEMSLTARMKNVLILSLHSSRAQLLFAPAFIFGVFILRCLQETSSSSSAWGPTVSCLSSKGVMVSEGQHWCLLWDHHLISWSSS